MGTRSGIEWTETTWNPVSGCSKVSPGCAHCYAERMAKRLQAMGMRKYSRGFDVTVHADTLDEPLRWRQPRLVFVNSMSDLFHSSVPATFVEEVFTIMNEASQHTFQVLTKRPDRVTMLDDRLRWTPNIWLGVSIESEPWLKRLGPLSATGARTKFLSLEPLLGRLPGLDLTGIDWVIAGGESGPGARPMQVEWVRSIRDTCVRNGVPFFFKQWGGVFKKRTGRVLDGRTWDQMPAVAVGTRDAVAYRAAALRSSARAPARMPSMP
ncbi:MAG: phage Gp37/Gp68 family protein [Gammaproteobacteria bacterium]|nr:phage Gp37/Gp68 family protein [Gammaproteobacteria bacterium]